jgi:predicted RNase H-like nuclease
MSKRESYEVAGVDGCKGGWCVAVARVINQTGKANADCVLQLRSFFVASAFAEVLAETGDCELVCVDIPIGLCEGEGPRDCDTVARRLLGGPRASSVFPAPVRPCLLADDYETACRISVEHCGKKLSRQSFALLQKIRQVDDLMTPALQNRVREIHPEISFWALNAGVSLLQYKKTVPGQVNRYHLLEGVFKNVGDVLAEAAPGGYGMDDALDALVASWTAAQTICGKTLTLPENPACDSSGLRMEILCPAL